MPEQAPPVPPRKKLGKGATRIGPFVVVDELGSGANARVLRARFSPQEEIHKMLPIERNEVVVLKVMRRSTEMAPEEAEAFTREADLLVMLDHPGVVRALSRGLHQGHIYIALEYVEGEHLGNVFAAFYQAQLRMRPEVALGLVSDLAEALAAVHDLVDPAGRPLGLVHRDLAPKNVLVDVGGNVRLLDFGTAIATATDAARPATIVGTPGYLAPEQARGEILTPAADVYPVGVMLFELLTGRRAFEVENLPDEATLQIHGAGTRPRWPSGIPVDKELRELVDHILNPDPRGRPQDGTALYHLLAPFVKDVETARTALSVVSRDLVLSNSDRPPPIYLAN